MKSMRTFGILAALALAVGFAALATPGGDAAFYAGIHANIDTDHPIVGASPPMPDLAGFDLNSTAIDSSPSAATATAGLVTHTDIVMEGMPMLADFKMSTATSRPLRYVASSAPPIIDA